MACLPEDANSALGKVAEHPATVLRCRGGTGRALAALILAMEGVPGAPPPPDIAWWIYLALSVKAEEAYGGPILARSDPPRPFYWTARFQPFGPYSPLPLPPDPESPFGLPLPNPPKNLVWRFLMPSGHRYMIHWHEMYYVVTHEGSVMVFTKDSGDSGEQMTIGIPEDARAFADWVLHNSPGLVTPSDPAPRYLPW